MGDEEFQSKLESLVAEGSGNSEAQLKELASSFKLTTKSLKLLADVCRDRRSLSRYYSTVDTNFNCL
jgi:hypothetical protein